MKAWKALTNRVIALGAVFAIPAGASASFPIDIPDAVQIAPNTFSLHATVNTGGANVTYAWSKDPLPSLSQPPSLMFPLGRNGNGPGPVVFSPLDQPDTTVVLDVIGTYIVTLTVTDTADPTNKASAQTTIDFFPGNAQGYTVPPIDPRYRDPDRHLTAFLSARGGRVLTMNNAVTDAYYATVDPGNNRTTLADFEQVNGFNDPGNVVASFLNATELGDGLRLTMHIKNPGPNQTIASTFITYASAEDADTDANRLATVALEYSPGGPAHPAPFTKFFMYDGAGNRVDTVDFDGGGAKAVPAICANCHGGDPAGSNRIINGVYPNGGDIRASFAPLDAAASEFTSSHPLSSQEEAIYAINQAVIATHPNPSVVSLINGWYAGQNGPPHKQNTDFIPAEFTRDPVFKELYSKVLAKSCRGCHDMVETDVMSLKGFIEKRADIQTLVLNQDSPLMPHAIPDYNRFWKSTNPHQPDVLQSALNH